MRFVLLDTLVVRLTGERTRSRFKLVISSMSSHDVNTEHPNRKAASKMTILLIYLFMMFFIRMNLEGIPRIIT